MKRNLGILPLKKRFSIVRQIKRRSKIAARRRARLDKLIKEKE